MMNWRCSFPRVRRITIVVVVPIFILYILIQPRAEFSLPRRGAVQRMFRHEESSEPKAIQDSERRVRRLRRFCSVHKPRLIGTFPNYDKERWRNPLLRWVWMESSRHHLFYCATPKCGSTTWKSYIMESQRINWTGVDTHVAAVKHLSAYQTYKRSKYDLDTFLKKHRPQHRLMLVRNPWARLASAYDDKIVTKHWSLQVLCKGWKKYKGVKNVTFEQFIDCTLEKPETELYQIHTHPLSSLCAICLMDYNIILDLEEVDGVEQYLFKLFNFTTKPFYKPLKKLKNNSYALKYRNVSAENIKRLQQVYQYDIELFEYPKSPFDDNLP